VRLKIVGIQAMFLDLAFGFAKWLLGREGQFTPPRHLFLRAGIGGRVINFETNGLEIFRCISQLAALKPSESVLEVGCGIGRNAVPLTRYLNRDGSFDGLDIVPSSIGWCQNKITPKFPNFRFRLADVYNEHYNPHGRFKAHEYHFPYNDESFDFVFLNSVFTHMMAEDVEHYLSEIARVLKSGGRSMITFLLLNPKSLKLMEQGLSSYDLRYGSGCCRFVNKNVPEATIAYQEDYVRDAYGRLGLALVEPIQYGWWPGRKPADCLNLQDIVMAQKVPNR
jgi:ubiquinone/menaquinone biosynthesis C-methylase UbiE